MVVENSQARTEHIFLPWGNGEERLWWQMPRDWDELFERRKLRLLLRLYQRERKNLPAPDRETFRSNQWDTILDLTTRGLVVQFPAVKLTAAGRRFVRRHLAKPENNQAKVGTDD